MPSLDKIKKNIIEYKKFFQILALIFCLPFGLTVLNLIFSTLFQLGIYSGTFLRFLYSIVVY